MYSTTNFIVPITNSEQVLKIRNSKNIIIHLIKEPKCTLKVIDQNVYIKQNAESTVIVLDFANNTESSLAHTLLRNALEQLNQNINNSNVGSGYKILNLPAIDAPTGVDTEIALGTLVNQILSLYINGILLDSDNYNLLLAPPRLVWRSTAIYPLDTNDDITINYI